MVFVTGRAGTGKSTLLRALSSVTDMKHVVLAPTGIAAINVGGQTIHSFFQLPLGPQEPGFTEIPEFRPSSPRHRVIKQLQLLVIDEISMVRADLLDAIDHSLRINRKRDEPFGGVTVVAFGDVWQLEPVVSGPAESEFLAHHYASPFFFDSRVCRQCGLDVYELKTVHRQASDQELLFALDRLRSGDPEPIHFFNSMVRDREKRTIVLTATNAKATQINFAELAQLPGAGQRYQAKVDGNFGKDLPAENMLHLKPGARVMFVRNGEKWVNGTLGTVTALAERSATIQKDDGESVTVEPETWEKNRYGWDRANHRIVTEPIGSFVQLPLRLAWAVTVHKSQGLTLDRAHIDFDRKAFAHGQVYVALSRCRSSVGMSLARKIQADELVVSEAVLEFAQRAGIF